MRGMVDGAASPHSLLGMLPGIYAEDDLACRLVAAFDDALAPIFLTLDNLAGYLDPGVAPDDFVAWLGRWVCAADDAALPARRRRDLVARAVMLHARGGTASALAELIELVTGSSPEIEESGGVSWSREPGAEPPGESSPRLLVRAPAAGTDDARVLDALVSSSRPAHLPYRIEEPT